MNKLDAKQKNQFLVLTVLAVGFFGVFAWRMISPTPAAAGSPPPAKPAEVATKLAAVSSSPSTPADAAALPDAPPPMPGMRDPFLPGIADPEAVAAYQTAAASANAASKTAPIKALASSPKPELGPVSVPSVPALPAPNADLPAPGAELPGVAIHETTTAPAPLPVVVPTPQWAVTGVLQSGDEQVAVLRSGENRRIVRAGDMVDGLYRIVSVTRDSVVLRHGESVWTLGLGANAAAGGVK